MLSFENCMMGLSLRCKGFWAAHIYYLKSFFLSFILLIKTKNFNYIFVCDYFRKIYFLKKSEKAKFYFKFFFSNLKIWWLSCLTIDKFQLKLHRLDILNETISSTFTTFRHLILESFSSRQSTYRNYLTTTWKQPIIKCQNIVPSE